MHSPSSLQVVLPENWQEGGFGLYVHWPFCQAKCPYCDFNSHVVSKVDQARWADALALEIHRWSEKLPDRVLGSIFFGGGTPSLMLPGTVDRVLQAAQKGWTWANDIEITLEANPTSVEIDRFKGYAAAGVNRVSLGVQALDDGDLRRLGRLHDSKTALQALDLAKNVFDRVSFDLIYARQDQNLNDWSSELSRALSFQPDHLSLYQLTIEPGTAFWDRQSVGKLGGLPDEDIAADMYDVTQALCTEHGLPAYEVSNHARAGAESRHNLVYWRSGDWVGVGPGAHGRIAEKSGIRFATVAYKAPDEWLRAVENGSGTVSMEQLASVDIFSEVLLMGLRVQEGVDFSRLPDITSRSEFEARLSYMVDDGFVWRNDTTFGATPSGRLLLNQVISELLPDS